MSYESLTNYSMKGQVEDFVDYVEDGEGALDGSDETQELEIDAGFALSRSREENPIVLLKWQKFWCLVVKLGSVISVTKNLNEQNVNEGPLDTNCSGYQRECPLPTGGGKTVGIMLL